MKKILLILTVLFSFSVFSQKQTNGKIYIEHPAIDVVNEFNKAYISGDLDKLRELVTDDVKVWRLRNRESNGLNWINGQVERIQLDDPSLKIPHMGWNEIAIDYDHAILKDIKNGDHFYFVHSYQMRVFSHEERLAHVDYGGDITAIVAKDNMVGLQFHPEKSSQSGMKLIKNFLEWAP